MGCGGVGWLEMDNQCDTYRQSQPDFQIPARLTNNEQDLQLFFDWGRQIKPIFIFTGDT
jgi:hypothetical protein